MGKFVNADGNNEINDKKDNIDEHDEVHYTGNCGKISVMEKEKYGCVICGKGIQNANLVSFSKRKIKHIRRPNLHTHHLVIDGQRVKIKVCTTCKRSLRVEDRKSQAVAHA